MKVVLSGTIRQRLSFWSGNIDSRCPIAAEILTPRRAAHADARAEIATFAIPAEECFREDDELRTLCRRLGCSGDRTREIRPRIEEALAGRTTRAQGRSNLNDRDA